MVLATPLLATDGDLVLVVAAVVWGAPLPEGNPDSGENVHRVIEDKLGETVTGCWPEGEEVFWCYQEDEPRCYVFEIPTEDYGRYLDGEGRYEDFAVRFTGPPFWSDTGSRGGRVEPFLTRNPRIPQMDE